MNLEKMEEKKESKKKTSPRTLERIKFHTKKKVLEFKRDILIADDTNSMNLLVNSLKISRDDPEYPVKASESMKKQYVKDRKAINSDRGGSFGDPEASQDLSMITSDVKAVSSKKKIIYSDLS